MTSWFGTESIIKDYILLKYSTHLSSNLYYSPAQINYINAILADPDMSEDSSNFEGGNWWSLTEWMLNCVKHTMY